MPSTNNQEASNANVTVVRGVFRRESLAVKAAPDGTLRVKLDTGVGAGVVSLYPGAALKIAQALLEEARLALVKRARPGRAGGAPQVAVAGVA